MIESKLAKEYAKGIKAKEASKRMILHHNHIRTMMAQRGHVMPSPPSRLAAPGATNDKSPEQFAFTASSRHTEFKAHRVQGKFKAHQIQRFCRNHQLYPAASSIATGIASMWHQLLRRNVRQHKSASSKHRTKFLP
jgi:phage portal protein BeeE